jgi:hypothetical protein
MAGSVQGGEDAECGCELGADGQERSCCYCRPLGRKSCKAIPVN